MKIYYSYKSKKNVLLYICWVFFHEGGINKINRIKTSFVRPGLWKLVLIFKIFILISAKSCLWYDQINNSSFIFLPSHTKGILNLGQTRMTTSITIYNLPVYKVRQTVFKNLKFTYLKLNRTKIMYMHLYQNYLYPGCLKNLDIYNFVISVKFKINKTILTGLN